MAFADYSSAQQRHRALRLSRLLAMWTMTLALLLSASAVATAHGATRPFTLTDDRGQVVQFAHAPARIVTLLPSLTETVCVLGACARLVGTDRYSNWPARVVALPKLGALEDASVESIVKLHPDVVLASPSSRIIERLAELGVPVVALECETLADTHRVLSAVARLLGVADRSEPVWRRIEAQVAAAAGRVPQSLRGKRVYFEVSDAPHAASAHSFIGELLARLGLGNSVPGSLGPFPELNPEFVVRTQPDLIMATANDLQTMSARPGWNTLPALRAGRSCGFPPAAWDVLLRPGPRLGEAADVIVNCLVSQSHGGSQ